ncbi:MAG: nitroreductase family protein [Solirubrobacterales bacterium]
MDLQICIEKRRSIRKFNNVKIDDSVICKLVDAAAQAPSWKNTQVTRYYAVKNPKVKEELLWALPDFNKPAAKSAPVIIISTVVKNRSAYDREGNFESPKGKGWQMYDCGCSNMIFTLKASELGLGTVIMGIYDEDIVASLLNIPDTEEVVAVIPLGYYDNEPVKPKRKDAEEILKFI